MKPENQSENSNSANVVVNRLYRVHRRLKRELVEREERAEFTLRMVLAALLAIIVVYAAARL